MQQTGDSLSFAARLREQARLVPLHVPLRGRGERWYLSLYLSIRKLARVARQATRLVRRMGKARPKAAGKAKGAGGGVPGGAVLAATLAVAAAVAVGLLFPWGALTAPEAPPQQKAAQQKV